MHSGLDNLEFMSNRELSYDKQYIDTAHAKYEVFLNSIKNFLIQARVSSLYALNTSQCDNAIYDTVDQVGS